MIEVEKCISRLEAYIKPKKWKDGRRQSIASSLLLYEKALQKSKVELTGGTIMMQWSQFSVDWDSSVSYLSKKKQSANPKKLKPLENATQDSRRKNWPKRRQIISFKTRYRSPYENPSTSSPFLPKKNASLKRAKFPPQSPAASFKNHNTVQE